MGGCQIFNRILSIKYWYLLIVFAILSGCASKEPPPHPTPFDRYILWEKCGDCDFLEGLGKTPPPKSTIYYKFSHEGRCYGQQCEELTPFGFQPETTDQ